MQPTQSHPLFPVDRAKLFAETATGGSAYKNTLRMECQTNLLFLGRLLGYDKLDDEVHGPVAALAVQKNPALPIEDQDAIKERAHWDPRGIFKTTFSIIDSIQWIICFANVRICKLTATVPLAKAIAEEIRDHFVKEPNAEPTDFQLLFPEYCITPKEKVAGEYTAPCRTRNWREATVMAFSNETTISGWHFDVVDPDDIVDTKNSSTPAGLTKTKKNFRINRKTAMPWAYFNYRGTRYSPFDLWGEMINNARPGKIKLINRAALIVKNGKRLEPGRFPAEEEVTLLFPKLLSYEFLKDQFEDDYDSFMTQYMNDAYGANRVIFTREQMLQAVVKHDDVPVTGATFISWRFAYGDKATRVGAAVGLMDNGRMYIVEVLCGVFKPSSLAAEVVSLAKRHGVTRVSIEDTPGAKFNEAAILNYAAVMRWPLSINWVEFQEDESVRDHRMQATEPLIATSRLLLSDSIPDMEMKEVFKQFCTYGMVEDNEIPDVIARVTEALPKSIIPQETSPEQELAWLLMQQKDVHDRTHGLGAYAPVEPLEPEKPYVPPANEYGLQEMVPGLNC